MKELEALALFKRVNTTFPVTEASVTWVALCAESQGNISVADSDAIGVYHKAFIADACKYQHQPTMNMEPRSWN